MPGKKNIVLAMEGDAGTAKFAKDRLAELGIHSEICADLEPSETETQYTLQELIGKRDELDNVLTAIAGSIPDLIIILLETDGTVSYASSARGLPGDPVGKLQHELFPPGSAERHMAAIRRIVETGEEFSDEEILQGPSGDVSIKIRLMPLLDSKGRVSRILGLVRDMTAHIEAEKELRRRNITMQALAFASEAFLTDADLSISTMQALKRLGESADLDRAYIMKSFRDKDKVFYKVVFEWCAEGVTQQIGNRKMQRLDPESTVFKRRADLLKEQNVIYGHIRDFPVNEQKFLMEREIKSIVLAPILEGNDLWGMLGADSCRDERQWSIAELDIFRTAASILGAAIRRKTVEKALVDSTRRFEQVAEIAREMIWEVDSKGMYTYISGLSKSIIGYEPEEIIGKKHFYDLHPEANREEFKKAAQDIFNRKDVFHDLLNPALSKTGQIVWLSTNGVPITDDSGKLLGYRGSDIDITDRFKADQEKSILEENLRQVQKMESIGRLAGGVAHDFNNCLQVIQGFTELLLMKTDQKSEDFPSLTEIRRSAKHATEITHQLLAFSRKQVISQKILNLNEIVNSQVKILKRLIGEDIRLEIGLEPELANIFADSGNMQQILMNLVVNSRDAMPGGTGGRITVRTSNSIFSRTDTVPGHEIREGKFVCLSVSDNGVGMSSEVVKNIFEPFYTTKGLGKGTGLGLAVVHGIIEQHKGWIHVYSEPGNGSEFKVYIPAEESGDERMHIDNGEEVWQRGEGEAVLLVEDEEAVRNIACSILRKYGYEVWEASGCREAVSTFSIDPSKFKILISDVVMPDGNGVELAEKLNIISPRLKILLTSGYTDEKSRWKDIISKGYKFIYKPYPLGELLKVIHELIHSPDKDKGEGNA